MNEPVDLKRRRLVQLTGLSAAAATFPQFLFAATATSPPHQASFDFHPDVDLELTARPAYFPILSGPRTNVWKFYGKLLKGPEGSVQEIPGSFLGPILRLKKGQKVRIRFHNEVPAESVVHWHGLHVPAEMDGHPKYAIKQGETFVYEFEIMNRAGPYWYHPHPHWVTARQVYSGLAGLMLVTDEEEQALNLPSGDYDVPIVLQDRTFDSRNQLSYSDHMMTRMRGFLGDQILINGQAGFTLPVATRAYRLRLLNGSNSRIYKLGWDDGTALTVIGNDGGLLQKPEIRPYIMLAPGERVDLWVNFKGRQVGSELVMRSLPFTVSMHGGMMGGGGMMRGGERGGMMGGGMGGGMMRGGGRGGMGGGMTGRGGRGGMMEGGMMSGSAIPLGSDYPVLKVRILREESDDSALPQRLSSITRYRLKDAVNSEQPKTITLSMRRMSALLNGRSYKMNDVAPNEIMALNSLQLIEFDNGFEGGHGMMMPHPMHIHGLQFQIVKRSIKPGFEKAYQSVSEGFVDEGWKDVALVMPGEKVTLLKRFDDFKGSFMYHCHNLEHEDLGMMRDFLVR
jgi:FtsP/CotA-like multicopper oxidase with cupredoxin domain